MNYAIDSYPVSARVFVNTERSISRAKRVARELLRWNRDIVAATVSCVETGDVVYAVARKS